MTPHSNPIQPSSCDGAQSEETFTETLKILGDFWTLRIISALEEQPLRFCEIERKLVDSNPVTLTNRLKKLEETSYVTRQVEITDKQSVSYELTEKGQSALPVVAAIKQFSAQTTEVL